MTNKIPIVSNRVRARRAAYTREWRKKHPDYSKAYYSRVSAARKSNQDLYSQYKKKQAAYAAEWRAKNPRKYAALYKKQVAWRKSHPALARIKHMNWVNNNKDKVLSAAAKCRLKNKRLFRLRRLRAYRTRPEYRAKRIASVFKWTKNNPEKRREISGTRRAIKHNATPPWANRDAITKIYARAHRMQRLTGVQYSVDHIYPLKHPLLCGLHVQWNLHVMTRTKNSSKQNIVTAKMMAPKI